MNAFITDCGNYGVFPYGKQWMVIYHNEQLEVFRTQTQCKKYIAQHQATTSETVPTKKPVRKKTAKVKPRAEVKKTTAKPKTTRKTKK